MTEQESLALQKALAELDLSVAPPPLAPDKSWLDEIVLSFTQEVQRVLSAWLDTISRSEKRAPILMMILAGLAAVTLWRYVVVLRERRRARTRMNRVTIEEESTVAAPRFPTDELRLALHNACWDKALRLHWIAVLEREGFPPDATPRERARLGPEELGTLYGAMFGGSGLDEKGFVRARELLERGSTRNR